MPHDAHRVADTRGWLLKAADDLRGAEIDLAAIPPLTGDAAFHRSPNLIRLTSS